MRGVLGVLRRLPLFLRERGLRHAWSTTIRVNHNGAAIEFAVPNATCVYRARSFSEKEPETLSWIDRMSSDSVFWDVGANVGIYSIYAAKRGVRNVVAIEPSIFNLQALAQNVVQNDVSHIVTLVPIALTNEAGFEELNLSTVDIGGAHSTFGHEYDQWGQPFAPVFSYKILGLTLNHLVDAGAPKPNFLKIDVDGLEHLILEGGSLVLNSVDSCLVELSETFASQRDRAVHSLSQAGLRRVERHDIGVPGMSNQVWSRI